MHKKSERLSLIQEILSKHNVITVKELSKELGMSEMTVRRDVDALKEIGAVDSFYGGISLRRDQNGIITTFSYDIDDEIVEKPNQKYRIAQKAASLIEPNDVILIDAGSTTSAMIDFLPSDSKNIVYCYALNILNGVCTKENLSVVTCGGYFYRNTRMFLSEEGIAQLRKTKINKAFMAARGVTKDEGVTTAETYEIEVKKAALAASEQKILLVDSSKFGKAWYAKYARLEDFDIVITDSDIEPQFALMVEDMGIKLFIV